MLAPKRRRPSQDKHGESNTGSKLPRPTGSDNAARLARALHFRFRDLGLLRTALTHRSILHEVTASGMSGTATTALTNERLEFLGDAVLGAVAAEYLYNLDPVADEGQLTRQRVALVRAETLVRWAREIDLGAYLYLGLGERPGPGARDRMLAGAFEAVIGAIALDRGFGAARKFLLRLLERDAPQILAAAEGVANPKGRLQELLQDLHRKAPVYQTVATEGPDHARTFVVEVRFGDRVLGSGVGPSKREAEQAAAAAALAAFTTAAGQNQTAAAVEVS
ncbi:MAG: ribonuclease III [Thermomicrobiales bacterium]